MTQLHLCQWLWEFRVEELHAFVEKTESGVATEFEEFSGWIDRHAEGADKDKLAELVDFYYDDLAMIRDTVPNLLRSAQLLTIFGLFEHGVGDLCRAIHRDGKSATPPPQKIHLGPAKTYLKNAVQFPETAFESHWKFINDVRTIRNTIAHNGGHLRNDTSGNQARSFISAQSNLEVASHGAVVIGAGFCGVLLEHCAKSMKLLIGEANAHY